MWIRPGVIVICNSNSNSNYYIFSCNSNSNSNRCLDIRSNSNSNSIRSNVILLNVISVCMKGVHSDEHIFHNK